MSATGTWCSGGRTPRAARDWRAAAALHRVPQYRRKGDAPRSASRVNGWPHPSQVASSVLMPRIVALPGSFSQLAACRTTTLSQL
ncbi:MAG: hypothetical protein M3Y33_06830 [Actinomycetota bacterium]|nr:hypothetical protein [Actinomycetota bacterium]